MPYLVVEFEDGVQAVPQNWVEGEICRYPPYINQLKINKAIANFEEPPEDWSSHLVKRVFGSSTDDYNYAMEKVKWAQKYTDVESDGSMLDKSKRKHRAANNLFEDTSEEDNPNDSPQKLRKKKTSKYFKSKTLPKPPSPPAQKKDILISKETCHSFEETVLPSTSQSIETPVRKSPRKQNSSLKTSASYTSSPSRTTPTKSTRKYDSSSKNIPDREFRSEVVRKLNILLYKVKSIETKLEDVLENRKRDEDPVEIEADIFPLKTKSEVDNFEKVCKEDPQYLNKCVVLLKALGGGNLQSITINILRRVMTNSVAEHYSLLGRKKACFKTLMLYKVILRTVRHQKNDATEKDIDNTIGRWLVQAKLRKNRTEKKPADPSSNELLC